MTISAANARRTASAAPGISESRLRIAAASVAIFCLLNVAAFATKLLPAQSSPILEAIRADTYYCVLIPLTLPILAFFNYLHWLCYSFFTNN